MMRGLIEDLHRSRKLTSIHVAHNLNFVRRADRVVALERGKLIPASSLKRSFTHHRIPTVGIA